MPSRNIAKRSASMRLYVSPTKSKTMSLGALDKDASVSTVTNGVCAVAVELSGMLQYNLDGMSITEVYNVFDS